METASQSSEPKTNYLNADYRIKSWLLTTDHKRIAILYLISITLFFFLGGFFAMLIRLELLTPAGDLVLSDTYNKLFTMHGVVMIFLFLIPSIPAVFGNFLVPMMIGAKDLAFPRLNLASWYIFIIGAGFILYAILTGGVDTGWTFYTPYSTTYSNTNVITAALGVFITGFSSIFTGLEHHRHRASHARAGADLAAAAAVHLGALCDVGHHGAGHAGAGDHDCAGGAGAPLPLRHLRRATGRRPAALPAPVLVLFAPCRLHHDSAGHGRDQRNHCLLLAQARLRIRLRRHVVDCDRGARASWCGRTICSSPESRPTPR